MVKAIKKSIQIIINIISILLVIISVWLMICVIFTKSGSIPNVFGYSIQRVITGSMDPAIPENSLIIVKQEQTDNLKVGDVISFHSIDPSLNGMTNTHRIAKIDNEDGRYTFTTKGDANSIEDKYPVSQDNIIGRVVWSNLIIGKIVRLVSNPIVFVPLIIAPLVLILISHTKQLVRTTKQISHEQEEAYLEALQRVKDKKQNKKNGDEKVNSENE